MAMKKKGFELQFHWIFILIAGAIILTFFFSIVQKQMSFSKQKLSISLSSSMEAIFSGAIESKGTSQLLPMAKTGMAFSCSSACDCNFYIGEKATGFKDKAMFAPSLLQGSEMVVWSFEFKLPFRAGNFFFIADPSTRYYFIYDSSLQDSSSLAKELAEELPKELNFEFKELNEFDSASGRKVRLVFLKTNNDVSGLLSKKQDVSALHIKSDSLLTFYTKNDDSFVQQDSFYLEKPSIIGAVFSEEKTLYECSLRKALSKLSFISQIYSLRAEELERAKPSCIYSKDNLNLLSELAEKASSLDIVEIVSQGVLNQIQNAKRQLEAQNKDIILQSCPELY